MKSYMVDSGLSREGFTWQPESEGRNTVVSRPAVVLAEAIVGPPNFKEIWWLEQAFQAAKHVARVKLPNGSATGFLIGEDVFITNNHVFEDEDDVERSILQFDYRLKSDGFPADIDVWQCDPATLVTNTELDYSIVKVKPHDGQKVGEIWGWFDPDESEPTFVDSRVNIIQHPRGRFKEIAFRDNQVKFVDDVRIQYLTDTDYGSSGSPVLDDWLRVVALHNQRVPDPANPHRWHRNQGFRIDAILADAGPTIFDD